MFLHYLDTNPKNVDQEKQAEIVSGFMADHSEYSIDLVVKNNDFAAFLQEICRKDCVVIAANVVCLGASLPLVVKTLELALSKNITVILAAEDFIFPPNRSSKTLLKGLHLAIDIRNSLVSVVTKKALAERKADGVILGRRSRNKTHLLDDKEEQILLLKQQGATNAMIAKALNVSTPTLYGFYREHPEFRKKGEKNEA